MKSLFEHLALVDVDQDVVRNIVSQQYRQDPFDDLTSDPTEQLLAQQILDDMSTSTRMCYMCCIVLYHVLCV